MIKVDLVNNIVNSEDRMGNTTFIPDRVNAKIHPQNNSIIVSSNSKNNNDTTISPGGRSSKEMPFNLKQNQEYTFIIYAEITEKLTGVLNRQALSINFVPAIKEEFQWNYSEPISTINECGDWPLVLHIKVPTNATGGMIRLNSGMFENQGQVKWHDAFLLNENLPIDELSNFSFGKLVEVVNGELTLNQHLIERYRVELDPYIKKFRKTDLDSWSKLIEKAEPLYDIKEITNKLHRLLSHKDGEGMRQLVLSSNEKEMPMFGIPRQKFSEQQISNSVERLEILKFLSSNLTTIQKMASVKYEKNEEVAKNIPVFLFWAQGFENAPDIVKSNIKKIKDQEVKLNVHLLNMSNIGYYIDIPESVKKLYPRFMAHFSDYLRVALLEKYGGVWLDATVLIGDDFEKKIIRLLRNKKGILTPRYGNMKTSSGISNWFIATALPDNYGIKLVKSALLLWMQGHDKFKYYFHFHATFDFLILLDSDFSKIWYDSPYISAVDSHFLQKHMFETLDNSEINNVLKQQLLQKLTYKYNNKESNRYVADSVISKIIRMNI